MKLFLHKYKSDAIAIVFLIGLSLLFFWRVPIQGKVLLPLDVLHTYEPWRSEVPGALGVKVWNSRLTDPIRQFYPVLTVIQAAWEQGHIPFWNPYALTGMPIAAAGLHQAFYPITVFLLMMMPVAQAMSWNIILHAFLGAFFCYLFLRELNVTYFAALIGAVAFVFNGSMVIWMSSLGRFPTIMWMPLLFWALEFAVRRRRWRWFILGGLILFMQLLAGHLQMVLYSLTGLGFYACYRTFLGWLAEKKLQNNFLPLIFFAITLIVGLGLAAFQLLPILELTPHGVRSTMGTEQAGMSHSSVIPEISPRTIQRLFVPDILGTVLDDNIASGFSHEFYIYIGLMPLLFVIASLFSKHRYLAWGLVSFGLLVGLVIYGVPPFYQLFQIFYPSFEQLGFHRAQIIIVFFWVVSAALGADWIIRYRPVLFLQYLIKIGWIVLLVSGLLILIFAFASKYQARHFWPQLSLQDIQLDPLYLLTENSAEVLEY